MAVSVARASAARPAQPLVHPSVLTVTPAAARALALPQNRSERGVGHPVSAVGGAADGGREDGCQHPPEESSIGPPELPGRTSPRSGVSRRSTGPLP